MIAIILVLLLLHVNVQANVPFSPESLQLQQLINNSEKQIQSLKKILSEKEKSSDSLAKASRILKDLSQGIDQSIEPFQGTDIYNKALVKLQSKNNFSKTHADSERLINQSVQLASNPREKQRVNDSFKQIIEFQKQSVKANEEDLIKQDKLKNALSSASPGFVPKLHAQAELGKWRTSTRLSTQITELLTTMHAIREEMRVLRLKQEDLNPITDLIIGSEIQNKKQKGDFNK